MSRICIHISLNEYLAQWFINDHGGRTPVKLKRGSVESKILEVYMCRRPDGCLPDRPAQDTVPIEIPYFRNRPPEIFNHLPGHALNALVNTIRSRFDIQLWNDLHHFGNISRRQDDLIYAWMEKNGIELTETNWNAIAKRYQRLRNTYLKRQWAKNDYSRKKNT